jgi:hypothetical protein
MSLGVKRDRAGMPLGVIKDDGPKARDKFVGIDDQNVGKKLCSDGLVRQLELGQPFNNAR